MKAKVNAWIKKKLTSWVMKNYPFNITTRVDKYETVYVKKGKRIREYRTFKDGVRQAKVLK